MKTISFGPLIGSVACGLLSLASVSRAGTQDAERFLQEYPPAAAKLESALSRMRGTCIFSTTTKAASTKAVKRKAGVKEEKAEFAFDNGYIKVVTLGTVTKDEAGRIVSERANRRVQVITPEGGFRLTRKADSPSYLVSSLGLDDRERIIFNTLYGRFLTAQFAVFGSPLREIIKAPDFHLDEAEEIQEGKARLFRISYREGTPAKQVELILDPRASWVIRRGSVRFGGTIPVAFEVETNDSLAGAPWLRRVRFQDNALETMECKITSLESGPSPREEFTLSHYGLPEPGQSGGFPWSRAALLLSAGLAALALAVISHRLARRTPRKAAADTGPLGEGSAT